MSVNPHARIEIGICPGCGARIRFQERVQVGEFFICEECGDELEVVSASPIKLDWAFEDPFDDDFEGEGEDDFDHNDFDYDNEYDDWDN